MASGTKLSSGLFPVTLPAEPPNPRTGEGTSKGISKLAVGISCILRPGLAWNPGANREPAAPLRPPANWPATARPAHVSRAPSEALRISGSCSGVWFPPCQVPTVPAGPSVSASPRFCLFKLKLHYLKVTPQLGNQDSLCFAL